MAEKHTLYKVSENSIEPLNIETSDWMELRRIYLDRGQAANEVLLAVSDGKVRQIETRGGAATNGTLQKWNPCDESQKCGKRVLIIERAGLGARMAMPQSQLSILFSTHFRDAVSLVVDTDESELPHFRVWSEHIDCSMVDKYWQLAMEFPRESLPCIMIMTSYTWRSFRLPLTIDEAIQLVQEHLR